MVALLFHTPLALVVNPDLPAKSVPELIALLKAKPDQISFAHAGPGSSLHLAAELFQTMTGTKMNGVAYRGAPPALNDVMAGHVSLMFADMGTVVAQIAAGKVRALGVTSTTRVPAAPDIPTDRGSRRSRLRRGRLDHHVRTVGNAEADRQPAARRAEGGCGDAGHPRDDRSGSAPFRSKALRRTTLQKFLASEIDRWGDIIERAGVAKSQ